MPSPDEIRMAFSIRLRTLRHEKGYKQVFCAMQCGVSEREWRRWESGHYLPHPHSFNLLTKIFPGLAPDRCPEVSGYN